MHQILDSIQTQYWEHLIEPRSSLFQVSAWTTPLQTCSTLCSLTQWFLSFYAQWDSFSGIVYKKRNTNNTSSSAIISKKSSGHNCILCRTYSCQCVIHTLRAAARLRPSRELHRGMTNFWIPAMFRHELGPELFSSIKIGQFWPWTDVQLQTSGELQSEKGGCLWSSEVSGARQQLSRIFKITILDLRQN